MDVNLIVIETNLKEYAVRRGKVRDVYDLQDGRLAIVTTDRISAFDRILPTGIPGKGRLLTQATKFWLNFSKVRHHFLTDDVKEMPAPFQNEVFAGRTMLVWKCTVLPAECIVRGYLAGSAWTEYKNTGTVGEHHLPAGLHQSQALIEPIFTPSTKAETGHDEPITFSQMQKLMPRYLAEDVRNLSIDIYRKAAAYLWHRGIILADTKFEFGLDEDGKLTLIDEVLTPDSSRYWPLESYVLDKNPPSLDKQYVRDWLLANWDMTGDPPTLPDEVVEKTAAIYRELVEKLTSTDNK